MLVPVFLLKSSAIKNIDREHFIERLGLLVIILLGESIISISYSLREIDFSQAVISNAFVGFLLIGAVWWIYFDSLPLLQESHNDPKGYVLILTHVFVCIGFGIVANTISHAILNNLITSEFRILLLIGLLLLYFGKQTPYFFTVLEYRRYILLNSVSVFAIYSLSFFTESKFLILSLTTLPLFLYIALNYRAQRQLYGKVYL
ncbi:low temperature requirement protein A [Exiguobacterium sp. s189]|uniref:low temperature requirement protein A n=1 Tax=Exiguobacterium sp. s189 TaxID=2751263 RepID=UPI001BE57227